jgi:hypothetical protein
MPIDVSQIRSILAALPGGPPPVSSPLKRASVFDSLELNDLTDGAKCELAKFFILDNCPYIGRFASNGDAGYFLAHIANDLTKSPCAGGIASRRLEHVAFAISAIAEPSSFASSPGVLASVYLLHQLEFLFRAMSGTLDIEGNFITPQAKATVEQKLRHKLPHRIFDVAKTYKIMRLNSGVLACRLFEELDAQLPHSKVAGGILIFNIGERVSYFRHPVSHGPLADPSSEACFYALLVTIAVYGSNLFPRS